MNAAPNWHHLSQDEVLSTLESTRSGLDEEQIRERQLRYGTNRLPEPPRRSLPLRLLLQFNHVLIYVLLAAAAITALLGHWVDTWVILAVVIANAVIGFVQEGKAEKAMDAIRHMLAPRAAVLRDGRRRTVAGEQLVPGDIVLLEAGDKVPADLRLLHSRNLQIQEAVLTGESLPVEKRTGPVAEGTPLGDRSCLAFSGTIVTMGQGRGVVVATGGATEIGRISGLLSEVDTLTTPLVAQMDAFSKWLTLFILTVAGLILTFGYFVQHQEFGALFMAVVGLSVAAIPEGLPAVLTITLAVGVQTMARRNAIVRRLPAIETLGSISVICSDKTGTLTHNEMTAVTVVTHAGRFDVAGTGYEPVGDVSNGGAPFDADAHPPLRELGRAAALCNDAELKGGKAGWSVEGDPMEGALLVLAAKLGADAARRAWTRIDVIPFESTRQFMATLHRDREGRAFVFVKGAPERLLALCERQRGVDGTDETLNEAWWRERVEEAASLGQRVLALALKPVQPERAALASANVEGGLTLLGLVGLMDPPRPEAIAAVEECHRAGIRVKMITGDHAATATAIGRQVGLQRPDFVLTGPELDQLDDASLATAALETDVFARTTPEHKLRLVTALQSRGMTVAMTGDGVNDAPALKRADAGIAMGNKGSEAAKETADLVLADDNFASIAAAVREGRTVYDNIKKVIAWTLPTNAGEAAVIVLALMLGLALPVTPVQVLWVNTITAVTLGIALAFEPTEGNTMRRPPRPRREPLLNGAVLWHIVLMATLFLCGVFGIHTYAVDRGYSLELARTLAMNALVAMEMFHLFFIRKMNSPSLTWRVVRGTKMVWASVFVVAAAQLAVTYLPPLQSVFATEPVSLSDGLLVVGIGAALFVIIEIEKRMRLRFPAPARTGDPKERWLGEEDSNLH